MDLWFAVLVREACWSIFIAMIAGTTKTCREQHLEQRKRRYMYVKLYNAFHKNILRILFCPQASILLKTHPKIYPEFHTPNNTLIPLVPGIGTPTPVLLGNFCVGSGLNSKPDDSLVPTVHSPSTHATQSFGSRHGI